MARAIRIASLALVALFALAAGAWLFIFATPPGRLIVKSTLESQLGAATGGSAKIGKLGGAPPGRLVLEDISFSAGEDDWLTVRMLTLDWRPLALVTRRIDADRLAVDGARLIASPPTKEKQDKPRGFTLPETLPQIRIGEIRISDFRVDKSLAGKEARLDGAGAIAMGGKHLDIDLNLTGAELRDSAILKANRQGDELSIDLKVSSAADGAIATIADLGGPIEIKAAGDGPLAAYRIDFDARLGAYGDASGSARTDFTTMEEISIAASAALGERLANTAKIIGTKIAVDAAFRPADQGGELTIRNSSSALGRVAGSLAWRNRNKTLDNVLVKAKADLAADWRPEIRRYVGRTISVDGAVTPKSGAYLVTASVEAEFFNAALNAAETDLRDYARGPVSIQLLVNEAMPALLAKGGEVAGEFNLTFADGVEAETMTLITPAGAAYDGDATYRFEDEAFTVDGEFRAPPQMIAAFNRKLAAKTPAVAAISIKGWADNFGGAVKARIPALVYNGEPLPPTRLDLQFSGAPSAPAGTIDARADDGSRKLTAIFDGAENGSLRIEDIDYVGAAFALKGSAAFAMNDGEIALDLAYRGNEGAEAVPGTMLEGDFTAKGSISRSGAANRLRIESGALKSDRWSLANLKVSTDGPSDRLAVKATAAAATIKGAAPISNLSIEMTAALRKSLDLTITKLSAEIASAAVALSTPATVKIGEQIEIARLKADIGKEGKFALDGMLGSSRWRARMVATKAPIVSAASVVDLDIDLDTSRATLARGNFTFTSLLTNTKDATLSGVFAWDGKTLSVNDADNSENFDLSLALPVVLRRTPFLSLAIEGPLKGHANYSGRLEAIAGFLPAALQSLEGDLSLEGAAAGSLDNPKVTGSLKIANAAYTELNSGLSVVNIDGSARAEAAPSGSKITFEATGAGPKQSEKTVLARGDVAIAKETRIDATINLNGAKLGAGPINEVNATGAVNLAGSFRRLVAKGDIEIKSLNAQVFTPESTGLVPVKVVVVDRNGDAVSDGSAAATDTTVAYDLNIKANDRIFVRGRGLESEWRAAVQIQGEGVEPIILGSMTMRDGVLTFAGRRFELTKGQIAFDRLAVNNPTLDISAERETGSGTTATILIEGRAKAPKITLNSSPPLPQEDIMALVLFDKPANELSAFESLQVAQGLAELGGIGPFGDGGGLTGSARQALGLDLLNFDIDESDASASSLTVGKYVADGLFVSATQDARGENGSVRIEYEINNSFTVETELRQDGDQKVSGNWKHDF